MCHIPRHIQMSVRYWQILRHITSTGSSSSWSRPWPDLLLNSVQEGCSDFLFLFFYSTLLTEIPSSLSSTFYYLLTPSLMYSAFWITPWSVLIFLLWYRLLDSTPGTGYLKHKQCNGGITAWVQLNLCCENHLCMRKKTLPQVWLLQKSLK